jgi:hypothetical protein
LDPAWSDGERSLVNVLLVVEVKAHSLEGEEERRLVMLGQQHEG